MLTCLIPLAVLILLFAGGMVITVYLHAQGAIDNPGPRPPRRLSPASLQREVTAEDKYYLGLVTKASEMDHYVRRSVLSFLALAFVLSLLLALFFNSLH